MNTRILRTTERLTAGGRFVRGLGQLQPVLTEGQLTPAVATTEWRLPAEPWVFLVDGEGIVRGSYMLVFDESELDAAIGELG